MVTPRIRGVNDSRVTHKGIQQLCVSQMRRVFFLKIQKLTPRIGDRGELVSDYPHHWYWEAATPLITDMQNQF